MRIYQDVAFDYRFEYDPEHESADPVARMTTMRGDAPGAAARPDDAGLVTDPERLAAVERERHEFLADVVAEAGADRAVVALDGGLGSTAVATLAADALGADRVTGLVMPAYLTHAEAAQAAEFVAEVLGVDHTRVQLTPLLAAFQTAMESSPGATDDLVATESALARLRTACLYYVANVANGVVLGTADRTALFTGAVVKYGDTGVDSLPLGDLYRTEVRALASALDLPEPTNTDALGAEGIGSAPAREEGSLAEADRDRALHGLVDRDESPATVADRLGLPREAVERVATWCAETAHKRRVPPTPANGD
ncbi:MAG: NAD(+) synthase [Haloferacaceae archaeon]